MSKVKTNEDLRREIYFLHDKLQLKEFTPIEFTEQVVKLVCPGKTINDLQYTSCLKRIDFTHNNIKWVTARFDETAYIQFRYLPGIQVKHKGRDRL